MNNVIVVEANTEDFESLILQALDAGASTEMVADCILEVAPRFDRQSIVDVVDAMYEVFQGGVVFN